MDWTPGGMSDDIEDRRDSSGGGGFGFGGGGLGIIGFIVLLVLSLVTGRNFIGGLLSHAAGQASVHSSPQAPGKPHPAGEDRDAHLISFVLDDAQATWTRIFAAQHRQYRHAKLVLYRGTTYSGCGTARATTGPFYCPQDEKIYIDLSFWDELRRFGGDTGDFAQAYVITHELGHHVQKLLGIESRERRLAQQDPGERNPLSVDLELQADCFAGVWAHANPQLLDPGDVDAALKAATAIGDDRLQSQAQGTVNPDTFTHGTSAQRVHWLQQGLTNGSIADCDTFKGSL